VISRWAKALVSGPYRIEPPGSTDAIAAPA